ncbi:AraC family transcriptional regulator [Saccharopolyspora sp. K220]|uniref:AraC family transcriptional regulator n=1 Tax=Saccharopolyspora soli TaxID=2926618 RepID=UPI001F578AD4|nr:AraC family transcriptional regulator [Saccharopolyspora soli]MCI2422113.1 AraC family transcriptional regulator [Saccharopolyspora soli]
MVKNGQREITELPYRAGVGAPPGVEVVDFPGLVARAAGHGVDPYELQRPGFHKLIAVRSGTLRCSLDFTDCELGPGSWLWARPGQLHRYDSDLSAAQGRVVLFLPGFLDSTTAENAGVDRGVWQPPSVLADAERHTLWQTLDLLEGAYVQWAVRPSDMQVELLRHLLAALVLQLAAVPGMYQDPIGGDAFARFQAAVEQGFADTHRVADYAAQLGYSVRTLTRASQAAVGCGAKRFIDERVLLEAKRLLIHTDLTAASIGQRVGFPGATVFTKFFRQHTKQTPTEFRAQGTFPTRS